MCGNHRKGPVLVLKRQEMVAVLLVVFLETTHGLSVVVTRLPEQSDQFAFFDQKGQGSCGKEPSKSCEDYGATEVDELCDSSEHCSCRCSCPSNSPTFIPHVGKCAGWENITSLLRQANLTDSGCDLVVASNFDPSSVRCPLEADVVTLNTSANGTRPLCSRSLLKGKEKEKCIIDSEGSMVLEDGRWRNVTGSASFSSRAQKLQWTPLEHSLAARLIMFKVSCSVWLERPNHWGVPIPYLQQVKSCLLLKSSGLHKVMLADPPSSATPSNTHSVGNLTVVDASKPATTILLQPSEAPATTDGKFATETVGDGANEALFIVALILGASLLGVLLYAAVFTVRHRMNSASKNLHHGLISNPMYEKGIDQSFTATLTLQPHGGEQGHIYQPLVANPRTTRLLGVSRTIAHSNPHSAERGVTIDSEPIPRCFSESTAHEVMARNRPKDVVCTPNPIYQEVIPCNSATVNQSGLLPPPLPASKRPCRGRGNEQAVNCDAPATPRSAHYLELLSDDGTDSTGYLCPLEGSSSKKTVPDPRQHREQNSERSPNERPRSFNQNQELPKPPPQRDADDVQVSEDNSVAKEQTLSGDPLLALRIEHDLDYSSDIETSPPVEPCLPVLAVAAEVENPTIKRPRLAENATEIIAPKYYLATQV